MNATGILVFNTFNSISFRKFVKSNAIIYMKKLAVFVSIVLFISSATPQLLAQQQNPVCPCCTEEYQQFDFWLGDWVVYAKGKMAGFNKIVKIEGGCIMRENWKSVESSYTGTSYNFYDRIDKKWKQVWIDNQGNALEFVGEFKDNKMVLESKEKKDQNGNRIINRITWYKNEDGTVRQLWEQSGDGGLTFTASFDGLYRRRK